MADSAIRYYESNRGNPTEKTLRRIAAALGVSYFDLISKEELSAYESGFKAGSEAEEWQNYVIDELNRQEGYTYSDIETRLINSFSELNDDGQKKAVDAVEIIAGNPKYQRTSSPESSQAPSEGTDTTPDEKPPERP